MEHALRNRNILIIAYLATGAGILYGHVADVSWLRFYLKPFIMTILLLGSVATPDLRQIKNKKVFLLAMVFAGMGDVFLLFKNFFIHGLGAFLVMQILYTVVFRQDIKMPLKWPGVKLGGIAMVLALILGVVLPHLNDPVLRVVVPVYALSISLMAAAASFRNYRVSRKSYRMVLAGAILFMVSDTLIAYTSFVQPIAGQGFWIMSTYLAAQYLIFAGMLKTG